MRPPGLRIDTPNFQRQADKPRPIAGRTGSQRLRLDLDRNAKTTQQTFAILSESCHPLDGVPKPYKAGLRVKNVRVKEHLEPHFAYAQV